MNRELQIVLQVEHFVFVKAKSPNGKMVLPHVDVFGL
jgi:hypothetical protein